MQRHINPYQYVELDQEETPTVRILDTATADQVTVQVGDIPALITALRMIYNDATKELKT